MRPVLSSHPAPEPGTVLAAGTVLWRPAGDRTGGVEIALVHRPKYDDWSLPKGKVDPGEHLLSTAVRETLEETGFTGVLGRYLGETRYAVSGHEGPQPKSVSYWSMQVLGGAFTASGEVDRMVWVPPAEAAGLLTRPGDEAPIHAFSDCPPETATVLLVRHGHAGSRKSWRGADAGRPLNALGRTEAAAIGSTCPAYGPVSVGGADVVRCESTVAPLAEALGLPVESWPVWSEGHHGQNPRAAAAALAEVASSGRVTAICSQGGVLPDVLVAAGGKTMRGRPARKGSVWVLSYAAGELVAADYHRSLLPVA